MALDPIKPQQNFKFAPRGNTPRGSVPPPPQQNQKPDEVPEEAFVTEEVSVGDNTWIFASVQHTPKSAQKEFNNGRFSGTDINPMWRIKKLTEVFGPCGVGWYTRDVRYSLHPVTATSEVVVMCELNLYYKDPVTGEWSQPIYGVGGNQLILQSQKRGPQSNDEAFKMAYTDAVSIACKALGFSSDIYYQSDRTKYTLATELNPKVMSLKEAADRMRAISDKAKAQKEEAKEETFEQFMDKADANRGDESKGTKVPLPPRDTCAELKTIFDRLEKEGALKADAIDYATIMNLLEEECRFLTGREDGDAVLTEALTASRTEDMPNVPMDMLPISELHSYCSRAITYVKKSVKASATA